MIKVKYWIGSLSSENMLEAIRTKYMHQKILRIRQEEEKDNQVCLFSLPVDPDTGLANTADIEFIEQYLQKKYS